MPESILVQIGQCGNQIGHQFWKSIVEEYQFNPHLSSSFTIDRFFQLQDHRDMSEDLIEEIYHSRARAIAIDTESSVVNRARSGGLSHLFSANQVLSRNSGAGNNWSTGYYHFGAELNGEIREMLRRQVEECPSLDSFILLFSLGGGTGSGLGSATVEILRNEYPNIPKLAFAVYPSFSDDVCVSPYNAVLANATLLNDAEFVIPFHNEVLYKHCSRRASQNTWMSAYRPLTDRQPFYGMNSLIGRAMLETTDTGRYRSHSNIDTLDLLTNLCVTRQAKYLVPVLAPISSKKECSFPQMIKDLFSGNNHLADCSMKEGRLFSAVVSLRGAIEPKYNVDFNSPLLRLENYFPIVTPSTIRYCQSTSHAADLEKSAFLLGNSSHFAFYLRDLKRRCERMLQKKAFQHHYASPYSDISDLFKSSLYDTATLIQHYEDLSKSGPAPSRYRVV